MNITRRGFIGLLAAIPAGVIAAVKKDEPKQDDLQLLADAMKPDDDECEMSLIRPYKDRQLIFTSNPESDYDAYYQQWCGRMQSEIDKVWLKWENDPAWDNTPIKFEAVPLCQLPDHK